jgi:ABC-type glycerol-3-phosphate transport system permease component
MARLHLIRTAGANARRAKKHQTVLTYLLLILFAMVALLPLYYLLITSVKSLSEASTQATMWPESFEFFENVRFVLTHPDYNVARMFFNTMFVFALKAVGTALTCSLAAYGFAMYKFPYKNVIFFILLSTMMIPGEILGIPIYEFMVNSGLKEVAYIPLWIAAWFATDIFMIFLFRQFFQTIPISLIEAARVDGYSELKIFFKIVMPLNRPVFITVILLYFVGTYNDLYGPALYVTQQSDWLMANSISIFENLYRSGSSSYLVPWNYVSVASLIAMVPPVLLFSFMQKQFMESVAGVGIKG